MALRKPPVSLQRAGQFGFGLIGEFQLVFQGNSQCQKRVVPFLAGFEDYVYPRGMVNQAGAQVRQQAGLN